MNNKILLRKTCSVYASDLHFATMIFPFVDNEIEKGAIIKPILENNISNSIEKIIENVGIKEDVKNKIKNVDWSKTDINKIKSTLNDIEKLLHKKCIVHIIIAGSNLFIEKVNKLIDLWAKINLDEIEKNKSIINIINGYNFEENDNVEHIIENHEYILKTTGIEAIYEKEKLKKAN